MKIVVEISVGELVDKITILEIKLERIVDEAKRANVAREYAALKTVLDREIGADREISRLRRQLKAVNAELWLIEDALRYQERFQNFGEKFISLARAVYMTNDRRAALKSRISLLTRSNLIEEKSYTAYEPADIPLRTPE
jgi:hypothetical protein